MTKVDLGIKEQVTERLQALQRTGESKLPQSTTTPPADAPRAPTAQQTVWYELDSYVKLRDPLMLLGIGLILYGVAQFSIPIMFILAGIVIVGISWMMAR